MGVWADTRGVSEVLGAILVFSILIAALGLFQVTIVPDRNAEIEFKHNQDVQGQMQDLRNVIQSTASEGVARSQGVKLGVNYPTRFLFLNPGPASGTLRTVGTTNDDVNVTIENAIATNPETDDHWDGSGEVFTTGAISYSPSYNIYPNAPETVIENSFVYNQHEDSTLLASGQQIVNGKRISLVALNGSLSQTQTGELSVDTTVVSASTRSIAVRNESGEDLTINLTTRLSEETLVQTVFENQIDESGSLDTCADLDPTTFNSDDDKYIIDCEYFNNPAGSEFNTLQLVMEPNVSYQLRLAKVGVGSGVSETSEQYMTVIGSTALKVEETSSTAFTVEVRDEFNNPVSGVGLKIGTRLDSTNSSVSPIGSNVTDENGQVTYLYDSKEEIDGIFQLADKINVSYSEDPNDSSFAPEKPENVQLTTAIENTDASGIVNGSLINPAGQGAIQLVETDTGASDSDVIMKFINSGPTSEWNKARIAFVDGGQAKNEGNFADVNGNEDDRLHVLDPLTPVDDQTVQIPSGADKSDPAEVSLEFDQIVESNFFVLQVKYDNRPGMKTYFVYVDQTGGPSGQSG